MNYSKDNLSASISKRYLLPLPCDVEEHDHDGQSSRSTGKGGGDSGDGVGAISMLKDTLSASTSKTFLVPLPSDEEHNVQSRSTAIATGTEGGGDGGGSSSSSRVTIPKSMSMLELNVIRDMVQFGEEMNALSLDDDDVPTKSSSQHHDYHPDDNHNGFFIDSSDRSSDQDLLSVLSSSPDSVLCVPGPGAEATSSSGDGSENINMRRTMSMASMARPSRTSQEFSISSITAQQDIHTISEEGSHHHHHPNERTASEPINTSSVRSYRRSSSAGTAAAASMPRRSSMKGSRNNLLLRSSGLDDSITSISSSINNVSNHSIESNNSNDGKMKRNVSFSNLEIRSYNVTLGDAPTSNGPPVCLSWEYDPNATEEHAIDHYEHYRNKDAPRRNKQEMLMPPAHRQYLLMKEMGFSRGQIKGAIEEAKRCAKQRKKTVKGVKLGLQPVEEALEKTKRKLSFRKKR